MSCLTDTYTALTAPRGSIHSVNHLCDSFPDLSRWHNGSVSALKSKDMWFDPGSVQDFSHISDLLGLSGWLGVIGTECGLSIGSSS